MCFFLHAEEEETFEEEEEVHWMLALDMIDAME